MYVKINKMLDFKEEKKQLQQELVKRSVESEKIYSRPRICVVSSKCRVGTIMQSGGAVTTCHAT